MKALVLGGTEDHIRLIEILKQKGYYVYLVDYYLNPPAAISADTHIRESTLDKEYILQLASQLNVDLVISSCIDQALPIACYVGEKLNLPIPFSYETSLIATNKQKMKTLMSNIRVQTPKHIIISDIKDINSNSLNFPLIVKPVDSNGSYGVKKTHNLKELYKYASEAMQISREKKIIIEEFVEGIEISVDAFINEGKSTILMLTQLNKYQINNNTNSIYQSIIPAVISDNATEKIRTYIDIIAAKLNLENTPFLMQVLVNNDEVNIIEFSPRIGGGSKHKTINKVIGFDILHASINSFFKKATIIKKTDIDKFFSRCHLYVKPSIFNKIELPENILIRESIEEIVMYKTRGMKIGSSFASRERVGSVLVSGDSLNSLKSEIELIMNSIKIYDENGNDVFMKEMYSAI